MMDGGAGRYKGRQKINIRISEPLINIYIRTHDRRSGESYRRRIS